MSITTINPFTEVEIKTYNLLNPEQVSESLETSQLAYENWRKTTFQVRSELMSKAAVVLRKNKQKYAETITEEMGKTVSSAIAEVEKCAWVCEYYAQNAECFLKDELVETDASKSFVTYQPMGAILAVMPWNYPFWQVFRFAAPTLMAGNVGILKHASNVVQCGFFIQEVFEEAGFPKGCFTNLCIKSEQVKAVIENDIVKAVTLTGSEKAGAAVASIAAAKIKKAVLELGGNDAYIILEDADLLVAAEECSQSRLLNSGQSCIGAKRFIVVEKVYEEFINLFTEKLKLATLGDPKKDTTKLAPMARKDLRDELHEQVLKSVSKGAKLSLGGYIPEQKGAFYPATILENVKPGMPAYHEELFGPVASVIKVKDEQEAIQVANDSVFGLGSCVFTTDIAKGERIAKLELQAGCCFVNEFVKSDPRLPFGGIKTSGFGRELSHHGIKEFVNMKTVYIS